MRKLRAIVDEPVRDLATGSGNNKWKEAPTNDFRGMDPNTADARLEHAILEQPYGPPQRFAIPELLDMIQLRSDILADELKDLQQDPTYLHATLLEIDGRRRILEKDIEDPEAAIWWTQAAKNIWIRDYLRAIDWSELRMVLSRDILRHKALLRTQIRLHQQIGHSARTFPGNIRRLSVSSAGESLAHSTTG